MKSTIAMVMIGFCFRYFRSFVSLNFRLFSSREDNRFLLQYSTNLPKNPEPPLVCTSTTTISPELVVALTSTIIFVTYMY